MCIGICTYIYYMTVIHRSIIDCIFLFGRRKQQVCSWSVVIIGIRNVELSFTHCARLTPGLEYSGFTHLPPGGYLYFAALNDL